MDIKTVLYDKAGALLVEAEDHIGAAIGISAFVGFILGVLIF